MRDRESRQFAVLGKIGVLTRRREPSGVEGKPLRAMCENCRSFEMNSMIFPSKPVAWIRTRDESADKGTDVPKK